MRILIILVIILLPQLAFCQKNPIYPSSTEQVLRKAGKNRPELEKAIKYFKKTGDSLKLKATYFLIDNMDIHYSHNYYWADSVTGQRIAFNELDYPDFSSAISAFDRIRLKYSKLKAIPYTYLDIDSIKGDFIIDNVDRAFASWQNSSLKLTFDEFCEYILPYRASTEPLQNWRKIYETRFHWVLDSISSVTMEDKVRYISSDLKRWFINTWGSENRNEPLPRLGALQLLTRKKGNCDDIGDLEVYILRSLGYPAALEHVPYWATTSGRHFFNSTLDENKKILPFDVSTAAVKINTFSREPSKVIRFTYAKQEETVAEKYPHSQIPPGFMQMPNYKDVTDQYWKTGNIDASLFNTSTKVKVAYAAVFNSFTWMPTWWGEIKSNTVEFKNMCKGAVFLPMYYLNGKLIPAGYPVAYGYSHKIILKPEPLRTAR